MPSSTLNVYNKDGSTLLGSGNADLSYKVTDAGIIDMVDGSYINVAFSNSSVIGYSDNPNSTIPDYTIGTTDISFGPVGTFNIYEVEKDPYNITLSKNQIIVKCKDKTMEKDLQISFEGGDEPTWEDIVDDDKAPLIEGDSGYIAKNGIDAYYSFESSDRYGIWHKNLKTGEITKIYTSGYNWKYFFEDSKGNVYVSSSTSGSNGIIYLNGTTATSIYGINSNWNYFFEDSKGNVYASSDRSDTGIIHLDGSTATEIYTSGYNWKYFFEDSKGNVYVGAYYGSNGIFLLDGKNITSIYGNGYYFDKFFEDNEGKIYVFSSIISTYGIILITGNTATKIYDTADKIKYMFKDSNNNIYFSYESSSNAGLFHINDTVVTKIYEYGYSYNTLYEDNKGNVYTCVSSNPSNSGLTHLNGLTATFMYSSGGWIYFFEDSKGDLYVGNSGSSSGILYVNGATATKIVSSDGGWSLFNEDSEKNLYCANRNGYGAYYLNKENAVKLTSSYSKYLFNFNGYIYTSSSETPTNNAIVYKLTPTSATKYTYKEVTK